MNLLTTRTRISQPPALERVSVLRANLVFSHLSHRDWTNRYSGLSTGEETIIRRAFTSCLYNWACVLLSAQRACGFPGRAAGEPLGRQGHGHPPKQI